MKVVCGGVSESMAVFQGRWCVVVYVRVWLCFREGGEGGVWWCEREHGCVSGKVVGETCVTVADCAINMDCMGTTNNLKCYCSSGYSSRRDGSCGQ